MFTLQPDIWARIEATSTERYEKLATIMKFKHKQKLGRLLKMQKPDNELNGRTKSCVINLSGFALNEEQTKVLEHGLNFVVAPKKISLEDLHNRGRRVKSPGNPS